jgi:hypothetical protein
VEENLGHELATSVSSTPSAPGAFYKPLNIPSLHFYLCRTFVARRAQSTTSPNKMAASRVMSLLALLVAVLALFAPAAEGE